MLLKYILLKLNSYLELCHISLLQQIQFFQMRSYTINTNAEVATVKPKDRRVLYIPKMRSPREFFDKKHL